MSTISVETACDGCWEDCPKFEIEDNTIICDGGTIDEFVAHEYRCKYIRGCNHLLDFLRDRIHAKRKESTDGYQTCL